MEERDEQSPYYKVLQKRVLSKYNMTFTVFLKSHVRKTKQKTV